MNKSLSKTLAKTALVAALSAASLIANADAKQDLIEARQETQIWTTYALNPYLRAHDISVKVHDGKAVLSGKVDEDVNKDLAKE
ncbi:MAG: BON domain-containing protein, partial [Moraxellaceae bacterium]